MTQDFRLANVTVRADLGALALVEYAASSADTLTWYDGDGAGLGRGHHGRGPGPGGVHGRPADPYRGGRAPHCLRHGALGLRARRRDARALTTACAAGSTTRRRRCTGTSWTRGPGRRHLDLHGPAPHPARALPDPRLDGPPAVRRPCRGRLAGGDPPRAAVLRAVVLAGDPRGHHSRRRRAAGMARPADRAARPAHRCWPAQRRAALGHRHAADRGAGQRVG